MTNKKQFSIIILLSIISLFFAGIAFAADYSFAYTNAPSDFHCSAIRVFSTDGTVNYNLPKNAKVSSHEFINNKQYAVVNNKLSGKGTISYPIISSRFAPQEFPYVYTISYSVSVDNAVVSESSISVKCIDENTAIVISNSVSFATSEDGEVVASAPDARFNWGTGDSNIAVIYPDGESIGLYLYDGEQYISNFVSADDIAPFVDNAPAENTLIAEAGAVSVYVLTTGEISFIIGPDAEGKQFALIMSDLSGSDAYGYEL